MNGKKEIVWESRYYHSRETCTITRSENGVVISSGIEGTFEGVPYRVDYRIHVTPDWRVDAFDITYEHDGVTHTIAALHATDGWIVNGQPRSEFKTCIDIDITLTPFTNSLPINRLDLRPGKPQQIDVLYIDVLNNSIRPVRQQYTRKSETVYNFQNVPNDFEAEISVDPDGFVVHYPGLFERG